MLALKQRSDLLAHAYLKMVSRYSHKAPSEADAAILSLGQEAQEWEDAGNGVVIPLPQ